jgi:hypothetical protein
MPDHIAVAAPDVTTFESIRQRLVPSIAEHADPDGTSITVARIVET